MRDPRKEERLLRTIQGVQLTAVRKVQGLFKEPGAEGYNPDAALPWAECSTQTRAALILTQGVMAAERAKQQAEALKVFGMVLMQPRLSDGGQWEQMAASIDTRAIEATATPSGTGNPLEAGVTGATPSPGVVSASPGPVATEGEPCR